MEWRTARRRRHRQQPGALLGHAVALVVHVCHRSCARWYPRHVARRLLSFVVTAACGSVTLRQRRIQQVVAEGQKPGEPGATVQCPKPGCERERCYERVCLRRTPVPGLAARAEHTRAAQHGGWLTRQRPRHVEVLKHGACGRTAPNTRASGWAPASTSRAAPLAWSPILVAALTSLAPPWLVSRSDAEEAAGRHSGAARRRGARDTPWACTRTSHNAAANHQPTARGSRRGGGSLLARGGRVGVEAWTDVAAEGARCGWCQLEHLGFQPKIPAARVSGCTTMGAGLSRVRHSGSLDPLPPLPPLPHTCVRCVRART